MTAAMPDRMPPALPGPYENDGSTLPAAPWYNHDGYSMVDHQLDPLLEVIRSWVYEMGYPAGEPDWDRAAVAVAACKAGLDALLVELRDDRAARAYQAERERLAAASLPDPMLVDCGFCSAGEHARCYRNDTSDERRSTFHVVRIRAAEAALAATQNQAEQAAP